jgi:hypothetical protein
VVSETSFFIWFRSPIRAATVPCSWIGLHLPAFLPALDPRIFVCFSVPSNHILESVHLFLIPSGLMQEFPAGDEIFWWLKCVPSHLNLPHLWFLLSYIIEAVLVIPDTPCNVVNNWVICFPRIFLLNILNLLSPSVVPNLYCHIKWWLTFGFLILSERLKWYVSFNTEKAFVYMCTLIQCRTLSYHKPQWTEKVY